MDEAQDGSLGLENLKLDIDSSRIIGIQRQRRKAERLRKRLKNGLTTLVTLKDTLDGSLLLQDQPFNVHAFAPMSNAVLDNQLVGHRVVFSQKEVPPLFRMTSNVLDPDFSVEPFWHVDDDDDPAYLGDIANLKPLEVQACISEEESTGDSSTEAELKDGIANPSYAYAKYDDEKLPARIEGDSLPKGENSLTWLKLWVAAPIVWRKFLEWISRSSTPNLVTFQDYFSFFNSKKKKYSEAWLDDKLFAMQFMRGVNPVMLRHCDRSKGIELPNAFLVNYLNDDIAKDAIDKILGAKRDLSMAEQNSDIFFVDYEELVDISRHDSRVMYAPVVVFFRNDKNVLMPLAIQLDRHEGASIYTPPSGRPNLASEQFRVWLFARMHVACADANRHECVSHLGGTHLVLEPIIIAVRRRLPRNHAISKLLLPHFYGTLTINTLGRSTLLKAEGSDFDKVTAVGRKGGLQLIANYYRSMSMDDLAFPAMMAKRGFSEVKRGDPNILPGYRYRDDGFSIWNGLTDYVNRSLDVIYQEGDDQLAADVPMQRVYADLINPDAANLPYPETIHPWKNLKTLSKFLTTVLFLATAEHSAVNFGQLDHYSFVPARPLLLRKPMPPPKQEVIDKEVTKAEVKETEQKETGVTVDYIVKALPTAKQIKDTLRLASTLSTMLDGTMDQWARRSLPSDSNPLYSAHLALLAGLSEVSMREKLEKNRDPTLPPWPYLNSTKRMARSIAI